MVREDFTDYDDPQQGKDLVSKTVLSREGEYDLPKGKRPHALAVSLPFPIIHLPSFLCHNLQPIRSFVCTHETHYYIW